MRIVITGASRGIGAEFVRFFATQGHEVHAVSRHPERLGAGGAKLGNISIHEIDLENVAGPERLQRALEGRKIDLLVNNAGMYAEGDELANLKVQDLRDSFEVNTLIPLRLCQALLPNLGKGAKVVQITSLMGSIADNGGGGAYAYRMSKAALNMFNKSFSIEFPEYVALVLHPGWVKTDMGGSNAPTTVQESVAGMAKVIEKAGAAQSGKFFDYEGEELPW